MMLAGFRARDRNTRGGYSSRVPVRLLATGLCLAGWPVGLATAAPVITALRTGNHVGRFLTAGPDGAMWMIDDANPALIRVSPSGRLRTFRLPSDTMSTFADVIVGPDANFWFTYSHGQLAASHGRGRSVQMSTTGRRREYPVPGLIDPSILEGLAVGADNALWFTAIDLTGDRIGRLSPGGAPHWAASIGKCCDPKVGSLAWIIGGGFVH